MATLKAVAGPVNLGNLEEFTIFKLAEEQNALTGAASKPVFKSLLSDHQKRRQPGPTTPYRAYHSEPATILTSGADGAGPFYIALLADEI